MIPIRTDSPLRSTPYMNWAIIAVNMAVFVAQAMVPGGENNPQAWYRPYQLSPLDPVLATFLTYGFLHAGIMHLAGNMLFLYIFGNNVNDKMGHAAYLLFYLAAVVFSGVSYVQLDHAGVPVLGASGGVAAVIGGYLILFPRTTVTILSFFIIIGTFEVPCLWFVAAFFLLDVIGLSGQSGVAHSAHVGGTLFGAAVCIGLLAAHLLPRDRFDVLALAKQWNRRRQYRDAVRTGWNPYGAGRVAAAPPGEDLPRDWIDDGRPVPPIAAVPLDPRAAAVADLRGRTSEAVTNRDLTAAANLYVQLKEIDPANVLPRQTQLDVANQLVSEQRYPQAAEAYETFLKAYPKYEQVDQVELMVGLILARYLNRPAKAREYLLRATAKLTDANARRMATEELEKITATTPAAAPAGEPTAGPAA